MDSRLVWLALAAFVGASEGGLIAGLLPAIGDDMGASAGQTGLLVVGYCIAYAIGIPALAVLLGGVGRRRVLAGAEMGLAVTALLIAVTPFFEALVALRSLLAVAAGTFTGTALATAAMIAPMGQRGRYMQVIGVGQSLAALVGVPVGAWVAAHFGWRWDYFAIAAMAAAASLALYVKLPKGMQGDTQTMRDRIRVLGNPGIIPALCATLISTSGAATVMVYIGAILTQAGLGRETMPLALLASGIGALGCSMSAGRLADRFGNRPAAMTALVLVILVLAVFGLLPHLPPDMRLAVLLGAQVVYGYVLWAYAIAVQSQMAHLAPSSVPVAISLNMSAFNIGMAVAAAGGGFVVDRWGAATMTLLGIPFCLVALVIWLRLRPRRPG